MIAHVTLDRSHGRLGVKQHLVITKGCYNTMTKFQSKDIET